MSTIRVTPDGSELDVAAGGPAWARVLEAPALLVTLVVASSTTLRGLVTLGVPAPTMVPDEVVYWDLAKSIAAGGFPSVHGVHELGWGVVYQALIAPAWISFDDPTHAYHAALIVNSLLMSLAAVPAYFLSRMFVSARASVVVAAATVLVPSMSYTGLVMTENACYPAFLLAVLFIARALRSPSMLNQTLALLGLGLVSLTRIQGAALVGGYLVAVAVFAMTGSRDGRWPYLRRFLPTAAATLVVSLAPMVLSVAHGNGVFGWLGVRSGTFDELHVAEIPQWFVFLLSGLILYVAVVPMAATVILLGVGLRGSAPERVRLFASFVLPTLTVMLVAVAVVSAGIDVDDTENLNERYLFYVVPLLFVGLALWIEEGLPRPRPWSWVAVLAAPGLVVSLPIPRLVYNSGLQSTALLPWVVLPDSRWAVAVVVAAFALGCGYAWMRSSSTRSGSSLDRRPCCHARRRSGGPIDTRARRVERLGAFEGREQTGSTRSLPAGADVVVLWDQRVATRDAKDSATPG